MGEYNLSLSELIEIQNHEDFKLVLLYSNNNIPHELIAIDYLEKFYSFETCDDCINRIESDRKILLILTSFFDRLSYFNELSQIQSIYILETNPQNVKFEKQKYSKLVNIFTEEQTLIDRLRRDILLTYRSDLPISISCLRDMTVEQSVTSLDKNTSMFIWNQLFIYYLVNSPHIDMSQLRKDMIDQCKLEYRTNSLELKRITDFEQNCTHDNVLDWYTKDSFVFRLVNQAFRTRNINLICKFRYCIILLYSKLKELSTQQQETNYTTVYRGQMMKKNDLENLKSNIGNLVSTNTIMSTTRREDVARGFIFGAQPGILFEINIASASNHRLHPFADISEFGTMPFEREILFFAGVVFRIDSVEEENESTWIIKLTLTNETIEHIVQLTNAFEKQLIRTSNDEELFIKRKYAKLFQKYYEMLTHKSYSWRDVLTLSTNIDLFYLISIIGDYEKMIEFYKRLLLDLNFIDHPKSIVLHIMIGYTYSFLSEYDNASLHYAIALSLLDDNNNLIGELLNHIGDLWKMMNHFESALLCYEQSLKILISYFVSNEHIATIYRKISDIYRKQGIDEVAIFYEEKAEKMDQCNRHRSDFDNETSLKYYQNQLNTQFNLSPRQRADTLFSMSQCAMKQGEHSQALQALLLAKQIFENDIPPNDRYVRKFSTILHNIAGIYLLSKDYFNALIFWKRAIDIDTNFGLN